VALLVVATQVAADHPGRVVRVEQAESRDVYVPAGVFAMGVTDEQAEELMAACERAYEIEELTRLAQSRQLQTLCQAYATDLAHMQAHKVFVSAFRIDRDEVSVADYRACVANGGCDSDALTAGDDRYLTDDGPMVNVRWSEAQKFCRWRGGRLPTEAEWERAARGDGDGDWPWGATPRPEDFNHGKPFDDAMHKLPNAELESQLAELQGEIDDSDGVALLAPPGHYAWGDGPYGTHDMAGNVAEWTEDAYLMWTHEGDPAGYDKLPTIDPVRIGGVGDQHIARGGSWRQPDWLGRVYARDPYLEIEHLGLSGTYAPDHRLPYVGFRCVRPPERH
jgi:formylglycine-generating enzyme required for sulfatase activity